MKQFIQKISIGLVLIAGIFMMQTSLVVADPPATTPPATTSAQDNKQAVCDGVALTGSCDLSNNTSGDSVKTIVGSVINILSMAVGVISVIMIIIGGFKYITSSGDSNNVNSAKNTILYAIIGLVIVAMAQIIVLFVLNKAATQPKCSATITTNCTP